MGQHIGYCQVCGSKYAQQVYVAADPKTGVLKRACAACEAVWAQQRTPPEPEPQHDDMPWRRFL